MNRESKKSFASSANKRLTVQADTPVSDGEGGFTHSWSTIGTYWAELSPMRAEQKFKYKSVQVEATHYVKFRGEIDINENHRILYGTRIFEILTVEDIRERGFKKFVVCNEVRR